MSFRRHQSFAINTNNFLAGRLSHFVSPHVYYGNLFVEKTSLCITTQISAEILL